MSDSALRDARVLMVDDMPAHLAVLGEFLVAAGARLFVARSGEAALARLSGVRPDIVLLDLSMPGIGGLELCRRLKAEPDWEAVPVLFVTALGEVADRIAGFAAGGADYITKPFYAEEVLARIAVHLRIGTRQRTLSERTEDLQMKNEVLELEMQRRLATERAMQRSLDRAVLVATPTGSVRFRSDQAGALLERHFPGAPASRVPEALLRGEQVGGLRASHSTRPDSNAVLWLLQEVPDLPTPAMLAPLGLTPREAEILFWIAYGKTNGEIGVILGMAVNTVKKHVSNLLPKLRLETRISAALRAMELLGLPSV